MAAEDDSGEKTEAPSSRRIEQARGEGNVGQSTDLNQVLSIIGGFLALQSFGPWLWENYIVVTKGLLSSQFFSREVTSEVITGELPNLIKMLLPPVAGIMLVSAVTGGLTSATQTKFLWSWKLLRPKFSNLNPMNGLKRIFGLNNFITLLKNIAKLAIIAPIAYASFLHLFPELLNLMERPINQLLPFTANALSYIFWRIISLLFVLAILDLSWQKWRTYRQLKMSKSEVKDEKKSVEGDETTKMQIRAKAMQRIRQQMMTDLPSADVIVTNPTHYSVALRYTAEDGAPKVIAKGKGYLALRIREMAADYGIPVIERKPLARALFASVEVGQTIPYELYAAVAELLAYVYKKRGHNPFRNK